MNNNSSIAKILRGRILENSHLNTILPIYLSQNLEPNYSRERLQTPDNDFIDLDWVNKDLNAPILVLFHGTEGNSKSHYAKRIMCYLEEIGWSGVVPHFRGCSEELNLQPRFYHAGDTSDMHWILQTLKQRYPYTPIFAVGVSLGGNALLKFLGENPQQNLIMAATAISVPYDLSQSISALNQGFNKHVYVKHFLNTLLPKMERYTKQFGITQVNSHQIDTLDEFNNVYLCQFYDFKDSSDYYQQTSCLPYLINIATNTLILQAKNNPMIPITSWPHKEQLSPMIRFVATKTGGHAGFIHIDTNYKEALLKMPKFIIQYFNQFLDNSTVFESLNIDFMEEQNA